MENELPISNFTLLDYCKKTIDNFYSLEQSALTTIDRFRCSLATAAPLLANEMQDKINEYCTEHGIENVYDVEEVFWADAYR